MNLRDLTGTAEKGREIWEILRKLDLDGNGRISAIEGVAACLKIIEALASLNEQQQIFLTAFRGFVVGHREEIEHLIALAKEAG